MEIKNCAHCGNEAYLVEVKDENLQSYPFRVECSCGISTCNFRVKEIAVDIWNGRVEQDGATIDRWFNEATEQRARAELLQMQVDELSEALNHARRIMAYAGKLQ